MFDTRLLRRLYGTKFPGSRSFNTELTDEGGTMSNLFVGRQGSGKTTELARHLIEKFERHPDRAMFVLDWSGSISDELLKMAVRKNLLHRIIYDEMGHPEWVVPLPSFSHLYGSSYDEQAARIARNLERLSPTLVANAPVLGGIGLKETAPKIFRLMTAITNQYGETYQITEAKKLLKDIPSLRAKIAKYGYSVPQVTWYFNEEYMRADAQERDLRTYTLISLLGAIDTPTARARMGYYRPGWTPREVIKNSYMFIENGARMINQESTQYFLFTDVYSLIMEEINKRMPADPKDQPVSIVLDEVYSLLSIPGMAQEVGKISPQYRSRKLELYIVLQSLSQLAEELRELIWNIGNVVCFSLSNFQEAYEMAQQMFYYNPWAVKYGPKTDTQQNVTEPDRGQYLQLANNIQHLRHREALVRRYISEKRLDPYIRHVIKTPDVDQTPVNLDEVKLALLQKRGVRLRDALEYVDQKGKPDTPDNTPRKIK